MNYPTITIQGNILSAELLEELERDAPHQNPRSFGLEPGQRVKDEMARAWGEVRLQWQVFQSKKSRLKDNATGTSETRQFWITPFLDTLGYTLTYQPRAEVVTGETYAISHRDEEIDGFPVHIVGFADSLDRRRETGTRLSPHALVQEYLNLTEHLYAFVTNGYKFRLLRDSSRLTRLSYLEFDLEGMMENEVFADFAIFYRLLHRSRMPQREDAGAESIIEQYHQMALEAGARIRDRLSSAVKEGIERLANTLIQHRENRGLREKLESGEVTALELYNQLLRLIYRLLFLMVIEERDLVYPKNGEPDETTNGQLSHRAIYNEFYSVSRLRKLAENRHLINGRKEDLWTRIMNTFRLFESRDIGQRLGIAPLAGELFSASALDALQDTQLDNQTLLYCLDRLTRFQNKQGVWTRVNYAALNVEEFGSVYEGLLDFEPYICVAQTVASGTGWAWGFREGEERSTTGSHYTPDELVRPLVEHALDPVIENKLEAAGNDQKGKAQALLSLKVCDVACGSGHFLLAAARRIAHKLAQIQTGEEQPNPSDIRQATREVISRCIYGVDKNPMAVELCKVALWLEAHDPGKPLTFLDHRIREGDALLGTSRFANLADGIAPEAFKKLPGDDSTVVRALRKRNQSELKHHAVTDEHGGHSLQLALGDTDTKQDYETVQAGFVAFESLSDDDLDALQHKEKEYQTLYGTEWLRIKRLADTQLAPFFTPKTEDSHNKVLTDGTFRRLQLQAQPTGPAVDHAIGVARRKRFFHWFLEFPLVSAQGGFDCILGNPPFVSGQNLSGIYGHDYLNWLKTAYAHAGAIDLVGFFFRRIFELLRDGGSLGCIATNTIAQGKTREGSLAVILKESGIINFAIRSMKWPGVAAVSIALIAIHKGIWKRSYILDGKVAETINSYLSDEEPLGNPYKLKANADKSFQGSIVLGGGFVLEPSEAERLLIQNAQNEEVLLPYLNGFDLNNSPDQTPSRWVINFFDWPLTRAQEYSDCYQIVEEQVKPFRANNNRKVYRERWWQYGEKRPDLYNTIKPMQRVLVTTRVSKTAAFAFSATDKVFSDATVVFALDKYYDFALLQSSLHHYWSWKHASTLKGDLRYTPSSVFETFPFPRSTSVQVAMLENVGERYYTLRQGLMQRLQLGLTKLYNLFHDGNLDAEGLQKAATAELDEEASKKALAELQHLRALHEEMDEVVRDAYGWQDLDLNHDFHEVDFLPENDGIRYTISLKARKNILRRLLQLNHERHAEEVAAQKGRKSIPMRQVDEPVQLTKKRKSAPPAFKEAILIAALVRELGTEPYPLGRYRRGKLSYLIKRKAEQDVKQSYLTKAAGPYDPWTRYGGPERIAEKKNYVTRHTSKTGREGFIPGDHVEEINRYLDDNLKATVRWAVKTFRYRKDVELELLTTVDFAALHLRDEGQPVIAETIEVFIANNEEWAPKLNRKLFSRSNIDHALSELQALFGADEFFSPS